MSTEETEDMKNVVESVVKGSGQSKKDFSDKSGISRSTLYSHMEGDSKAGRLAQLFWKLSQRVQEESPEIFREVVLGETASGQSEDLLKLTRKAQKEIESIMSVLNSDSELMASLDDPEERSEYEDAMHHLKALNRIFKLREIAMKDKRSKE